MPSPALRTSAAFVRLLILALAASSAVACSRPGSARPDEQGIMLSLDEILARPPALERPGPVKVWAAEKASDLGVYYVFSAARRVGPTRQDRAALRIVLLKGRAEIRVGDIVQASGSGAYAVAPPGTAWSLERLGPEPLVFSVLVLPDAVAPTDLLRPAGPAAAAEVD